jgi:PAS domain S-box-containing protein
LKLTASGIDFAKIKMAEVMTQQFITLKQSDLQNISNVLSLFQQYGVEHLPIVDDEGNLVGIINESSLLHELDLVKVVGVVEAVQETLENITNQYPENYQQREKVSGNNLLNTWINTEIAKEVQINEELQQTLEELQIVEEELRQQNEQLLIAREIAELERRRYQDLFEFTPDGYLVTDKLGIIQEANHAASSLLCVHQKYLVGKPITIFLDQSDKHNVLSHLSSSQHCQEWEIYIQPREEQPFPASVRLRAVYDRQGQWRGWCWLICNISEQKQAEKALRQISEELEQRVAERTRELIVANQALEQKIQERKETQAALKKSEETFRQFGENIQTQIIWIKSYDRGETVYVNPAYEKVWGRTCQSLRENPQSWTEAIHPEDRDRILAETRQNLQKGEACSL